MSAVRHLSDRDFQAVRSESEPAFGAGVNAFSAPAASSEICYLDRHRGRPARERVVANTLSEYTKLPAGWDSYGGEPLRLDTGMFALQVLCDVMSDSTPPPSLVPVSSGGVQCEWHENGLDIELYISAPLECELMVYDHLSREQQVFQMRAELTPLKEQMKRLVDFNRDVNARTNGERN